jgi:hypothetical protein
MATALLNNGRAAAWACAAWIPAWGLTTALLLSTGRASLSASPSIRAWILFLAALPLAISVTGFSLHILRAGFAIWEAEKLVLGKRSPDSLYSRMIFRLTAPTSWLPVIQLGLGIALDVAVARPH